MEASLREVDEGDGGVADPDEGGVGDFDVLETALMETNSNLPDLR
jgi:hypothetical protein